jgi:TolB-like protein/cytochrome c-type biogenesis protein CcmH/NrfG
MLQLKLFGQFDILGAPASVHLSNSKVRALLAYLALIETGVETRERLANLLWGSRFDTQANQSFRQALARLKKAVGSETVLVDDQFIKLAPGKFESDVADFLRLAHEGSEEALRKAVSLSEGEFLSGIDIKEAAWEEWLTEERRRLDGLISDVSLSLGEIEFGKAEFVAALGLGEAVTRRDYFREDAHRLIMRCLAKLGRRAEALRHYQELASRIETELGTTAEAATMEYYEAVKTNSLVPAQRSGGYGQERHRVPEITKLEDQRLIAVLPFTNLSNESEHALFADGLTDDLITDLSRAGCLFVVPSFAFKGRSADVRTISCELGVKYILEGSARRAGERVRINAKLMDATAGVTLWAERYDRELNDIFNVQDEVVASIVEALVGRLAVARVPARKRPTNVEAYDLCVRARPLVQQSLQGAAEARVLLERAVALDPEFSEAYCWLALATYVPWWFGNASDQNRALGLAAARRAVELDPNDPGAHWMLGNLLAHEPDIAGAEAEFAIAMSLAPNNADTWAMLSELMVLKGKTADALATIEKAFRLNPHPPGWYYWLLGQAQFLDHQYERAIVSLRHESTYRTESRRTLAASLAFLGRMSEAHQEAELFMALNPAFRISHWIQSTPFADKSAGEHFVEGYRRAGLPE